MDREADGWTVGWTDRQAEQSVDLQGRAKWKQSAGIEDTRTGLKRSLLQYLESGRGRADDPGQ